VSFTHREYVLLEYLARHAGEVVRRARIVEDVWGEHHDALSNVVEVHIQRVRRRLEEHDASALIRTHRGHGYELSDGKP
jgi:DNA-binding response OmpR family regulator